MMYKILPLAIGLMLVILVLSGLAAYDKASEALALQHNMQHLRLIETVAGSLQDRLGNMQAAFSHYGTLIHSPLGTNSTATGVCEEVEKSFTIVSSAFIVGAANNGDLWERKRAALALTPESDGRLDGAASSADPNLLLLRSVRDQALLLFLSPVVPGTPVHLAVVVPLDRLLATYHINDTAYDEDYLWILGRDGTLLYHPYHPEMVGNNVGSPKDDCAGCHRSFELEQEMVRGAIGYGWNDVPKGRKKIIAYAPLTVANVQWSIAVSEALDATTAVVQRHTRNLTLIAIILSLVIMAASVYITRANHLRQEAVRETVHLREERKLQQQLDRNQKQLLESERFATVGRMAAQMAHEIKNPLSSISLNTELLGDELQACGRNPSPEALQLIDSVLAEIDLLTQTVDEYLQFARFPKLQKQPISLAELISGLEQLLHQESMSRCVALHCAVDTSLPRVSADARLLRQALLNLVRNAFEAIGTNGWVRVEANSGNGEVHLSVSDSGPGVALENRPLLFEPFFTTKPKGTGLGLPLTRHIVFEHGGTISYEPDGTSSRFVITLPGIDPDPDRGSEPRSKRA